MRWRWRRSEWGEGGEEEEAKEDRGATASGRPQQLEIVVSNLGAATHYTSISRQPAARTRDAHYVVAEDENGVDAEPWTSGARSNTEMQLKRKLGEKKSI